MNENEKDQKQEEESQESKLKEGCQREVGRDRGEKHEQILDRKECRVRKAKNEKIDGKS